MENWEWIAVAVVAGVLVVALVAVALQWRRRSHLKERFGPEYHRAVSTSGRRKAERRLSEVEREHEKLELRPLTSMARERYLEEWHQAEARFVSDPRDAARAAERVVRRVLAERGYPTEGETEDHAIRVAVDHPDVVERYRHAHAMLDKVDGAQGTENLRKAMNDFRAVLEELLEGEPTPA